MDRMNDGGAFLVNHDSDRMAGVVETCSCDKDKMGRATVRFSKSALGEEIFQDIQDGIRRKISVGYMVHHAEEMDPKKMPRDLVELSAREGVPVYLVKDWEPMEISTVPVPADVSVGIGRSKARVEDKPPDERGQAEKQTKGAPEGASIISGERKEIQMPPTTQTLEEYEAELKKEREKAAGEARGQERARVEEITSLSSRFQVPDTIKRRAIDEGMSIEQFRGLVLNRLPSGTPLDTPLGAVGLTDKEVRQYSLLRAIRAAVSKDWKGAEFERDCSIQIEKQVGYQPRAFFVPYDILMAKREKRDLNVGTAAEGGYLVGAQHMASSFIELLRAKLVAAKAGVQIMSGLVGNVDIPKQTGAATAYWISTEGGAPTEGALTFGQVLLSPKNIGAYVDITRNLMKQSSPAADLIVINDLVKQLALGIDLAVFHGTGAAGQPTGIVGASGVGSFTGAAITRVLALGAITDVENANAEEAGMCWVTNPTGKAVLRGREQGTAGYPVYLCGDDLKMLGYPLLTSTQISSGYLFFGDFTQAVVGEWGVLDMNVDDKSLSTTGGYRIVAFQSVDVGVRQGGAFSIATGLT